VSETTISNCWRKTGILPRAPDSEIATVSQYLESDIEIDNNEIATIIANLPSNDDPNALEVTLAMERYIQTIDEPVITEDILSDQDIVAMVRSRVPIGLRRDEKSTSRTLPEWFKNFPISSRKFRVEI
jgi:hypothetical protein